jgi:hypothetical protein
LSQGAQVFHGCRTGVESARRPSGGEEREATPSQSMGGSRG